MSVRVIVGSSSQKTVRQLAHFLVENGYNVVGETTDGYDLLRRVHTVYPDISIIDYNMKGMNGYEIAETLVAARICPTIAIINAAELQYFINLSQEPTFTPLIKPCNKQALVNTIELLVKTAKSINQLENQVNLLKSQQDKKELVNKAKKLLMNRKGYSEEEAHRFIQKNSMDKGVAKVKIAEAIILMYD